jgi:hypothetical protein
MDRTARWLLVAALAYTAVVVAVVLVPERVLGHDEAVYAVGVRGLSSGSAADEYPLHRSIGMRLVAAPGVLAAGGDERVMRVPFALLALAYLFAVYRIGRHHGGAAAGALAAAVMATTSLFTWRAAEMLSDIPSAFLLLVFTHLCTIDDPRGAARRAALAGLLAATAVYVRYGSAPVVPIVFAVAFVSEPARRRWLVAAAACCALAMAPFLVWSVLETGSLLGVFDHAERLGQRRYYGEGLWFYLRTWPVTLAGPVTGVIAALGLVVGLAAWRPTRAPTTTSVRAWRLFATAALGQIIALGLRVHGEPRFIFFALTVLVIVAACWLAARPRAWRAAVIAVALTAVPSAVWTVLRHDRAAQRRIPFSEATDVIRADARGARCLAYSTEVPMTVWYTGCRTVQVESWGLAPEHARGETSVYLLEARGLPRSIGGAEPMTRPVLGWEPIACAEPTRMCVWRATRQVP